ncbi:MAG: hypothetical protein VX730_06730 [Pseudomonadota bacterium]|nr:hypothetical protein [Pseudomonadota bacterium]
MQDLILQIGTGGLLGIAFVFTLAILASTAFFENFRLGHVTPAYMYLVASVVVFITALTNAYSAIAIPACLVGGLIGFLIACYRAEKFTP